MDICWVVVVVMAQSHPMICTIWVSGNMWCHLAFSWTSVAMVFWPHDYVTVMPINVSWPVFEEIPLGWSSAVLNPVHVTCRNCNLSVINIGSRQKKQKVAGLIYSWPPPERWSTKIKDFSHDSLAGQSARLFGRSLEPSDKLALNSFLQRCPPAFLTFTVRTFFKGSSGKRQPGSRLPEMAAGDGNSFRKSQTYKVGGSCTDKIKSGMTCHVVGFHLDLVTLPLPLHLFTL